MEIRSNIHYDINSVDQKPHEGFGQKQLKIILENILRAFELTYNLQKILSDVANICNSWKGGYLLNDTIHD